MKERCHANINVLAGCHGWVIIIVNCVALSGGLQNTEERVDFQGHSGQWKNTARYRDNECNACLWFQDTQYCIDASGTSVLLYCHTLSLSCRKLF